MIISLGNSIYIPFIHLLVTLAYEVPCYSPSSSVSTLEAAFSEGLKYAMSGAKYCTFFISVVS